VRRLTSANAKSRVLILALGFVLGGCAPPGPPEANINTYLRSRNDVTDLHRVVFIRLSQGDYPPDIAEGMTRELVNAIQQRRLFHIDKIGPGARECMDLPLNIREPFSMRQLARIRDALRCDAVMFGSVTHFQTHPRMQIGLYVRLLDLKNGNLVWSVDHIWDSTDKQTTERMEWFFSEEMRGGYDPVQWRLTMMSPKVFQKFVAYESANTLPDCSVPPDPEETPPGSTIAKFLRGRKTSGRS